MTGRVSAWIVPIVLGLAAQPVGRSQSAERGASISGRVVVERGAPFHSPSGILIKAFPAPEKSLGSWLLVTAPVADDWSFRMTGLSGMSQFTATTDKSPFVTISRMLVDGIETLGGAGVELADGPHEVVLFVKERESPKPTFDTTLPADALVERFKSEKVFWRQFEVAKEIVARQDARVLPSLVDWLSHEDRHVRGNAAFIFAGLGDARGFPAIANILADRSDRPEGQGMPAASSDGRYRAARQVATDRYYAAHLLGDLRDPRAIPILVPLLSDPEVNHIVPWALGQIGDKRAIPPLLATLDDDSPTMRVLAIYALEALHAKEALPRLTSLLDDGRPSNFGSGVSVADAARAAIATLK